MIWATAISAIGATAGLFLAVVVWLRDATRAPQTLYLSLCLVLLAASMADDAMTLSRAYDVVPWLTGWSYPFLVAIGPLFLIYVAAVANPLGAGWRRAWGSVVAAGVIALFVVPWALSGGEVRWAMEVQPDRLGPSYYPMMVAMAVYLFAGTGLQGWCLLAAARRAGGVVGPGRRWLLRLTRMALCGWAVYVAGIVLGLFGVANETVLAVINLVLAGGIYAVAVLAVVEPPDPLTQPIDTKVKYARQALSEADIARICARLDGLAVRENVHRDSSLTLQKLAIAARTSPNDVSQALNVQRGGFHEWLAQARVDDVIALMAEGSEASGTGVSGILDAAFLAGFNSKSTFYEAFRRQTGQTPAAWLKGRAAA